MTFAERSAEWLHSEHAAEGGLQPHQPRNDSPLFRDSAHPIAEAKRIPVPRSEHAALISLVEMAAAQLAVSRDILAALGASSDSRSSIEVKTSARGVDISAKIYQGSSADGLSDRAVAEYFATLEKVQARIDAHAAGTVT